MNSRIVRSIIRLVVVVVAVGLVVACCVPSLKKSRQQVRRLASPERQYASLSSPAMAQFDRSAAAPGSLPSMDDELWVIAKAEPTQEDKVDEDTPKSGSLMAKLPSEEKHVPCPLKHTDVKADIAGYIATVNVTQQFHNPYDSKIEAVYVFPLPQNAAINEFIMTVGDRRIRGIIREREEAEKIYEEARAQGYIASLMTQERANIFTQKVANIEPGKQIDIDIKYFHTLAYRDGAYTFVFPMTVGPRFNPPGSTDGIGAAGRGHRGASGQKTEIQYLKPGERTGHDIALAVSIEAGVSIEEVRSTSHVIDVDRSSPEQAMVTLRPADSIPNKDFVMRYKVAGETIKSALLTHRDKRGGYFTLMLYPPENLKQLKRHPMEMVFVLDCSGSMSGQPIAQAKAAVRRALKHLQTDDTFQIIRFSNNASQLGSKPLPATASNIRKGLRYVDSLNGGGGTMMIEGIKAALDFPHDERRLRFVAFMTDGFIGNEAQILGEVYKRLGASRIFSFGVGQAPNRYLLDRMAKLGRGVVAYLSLNDSATDVMDHFFERVSHPAMTDIKIDWSAMQVTDVYPRSIPDLFVGRAVVVTGRYSGTEAVTVSVSGKVGDFRHEIDVKSASSQHAGIAPVWARLKIADLMDQATYEPNESLAEAVKITALEYSLMSAYTAFVAVDSLTRTAGDHGTTVAVPVHVPEGVRYETTVSE